MTSSSSPRPLSPFRLALAAGAAALRVYWAPFLLIQLAAFALVIAYYQSPAVQRLADFPARWREEYGIGFAFVAGFVAGGLLAELAKILTGKVKKFDRPWLRMLLYTGFVYGCVGISVDILYRMQAVWFGHGIDWQTLTIKTLVDMLLFSTLVSIPFATACFAFHQVSFSIPKFKAELRDRFYMRRVVPGLIPCWGFWTPVLFCTYALPLKLQLPFAILAEAAWSILFVFIATRKMPSTTPAQDVG